MKYALVGEKLGHSFSPEIHRALGGYDYELVELPHNALPAFLLKRDFAGINVTIPYKEAVIPYLDRVDDTALSIGAVNTVVNRDGKLFGYNTDLYGMIALIRRAGIDLSGKKALIAGSGGTSKTALAAARALGAREAYRVSRSGAEGLTTYEIARERHADAAIWIRAAAIIMNRAAGTPLPDTSPMTKHR